MTRPASSRSIVRRTEIPGSVSRPVVTPLWPSVVYQTADADELDRIYDGSEPGYTYAREGHPNAEVLAAKIDQLEGLADGAPAGLVTGSGMGALAVAVLGLNQAGDHIVAGSQLYGGTRRLLDDATRLGLTVDLVDLGDPTALEAAIGPTTRMVVVEAVSNPTLRVADMEAVISVATAHEVLVVVDNTFTTPRMYQPLAHGADLVVHSVTKLLAGHADATLGYVGLVDHGLAERLRTFAGTLGATPSPFDCWLAERGLHSFELRYDRAEDTARQLADVLAQTPGVSSVRYPGRADHPDHERARALFGNRGGHLVTFDLDGGRAAANAFSRATPHLAFAPTLGDVATTISHPASSSHRKVATPEREALGITEGTLRVSVGIEDPEGLIGEIVNAAAASRTGG